MKIVCISDTHALHWDMKHEIPDGDVLIHSGDSTNIGEISDVKDFNNFLGTLPHKHKIIISGNHDFCYERNHV